MCKEDIRIKRKTASARSADLSVLANGAEVFKARPERQAIIMSFSYLLGPATGATISIGYADNGAFIPIACVSEPSPTIVLTLEQVGIVLTYPIVLVSNSGVTPECYATEVYFYQGLNEL